MLSRLFPALAVIGFLIAGASLWAVLGPGGIVHRVTKIEEHKPSVREACRIVERGGYRCRKPVEQHPDREAGHSENAISGQGGDSSNTASPPSSPPSPPQGGDQGNQGGGSPDGPSGGNGPPTTTPGGGPPSTPPGLLDSGIDPLVPNNDCNVQASAPGVQLNVCSN